MMKTSAALACRPLRGRPAVLAVNAGSSSLKVGVYGAGEAPAVWSGQFTGMEPGGRPQWCEAGSTPVDLAGDAAHDTAWPAALDALAEALSHAQVSLAAVPHRIVHGGAHFTAPCRLDAPAQAALATLVPLAPLHQQHNLDGVAAFERQWPHLPQIGCFDTAFHATLPPLEQRLPLPAWLVAQQGLRRYGFHGLSYAYMAGWLQRRSARASGRVLLAHLGNGASLCALQDGRSCATSMGFSALDGLMMGTRCGSLDAGVVLHLWRAGWDHTQVESLLYQDSGLKGVSGLTADMRTLRASDAPAARLAIDLFVHRARREAGALVALLGGLDAVAFAGGIGEHDPNTREALCASLAPFGVRLDAARNALARSGAVQAADSAAEVWVIPTDEGRVAADAAFAWLASRDPLSA
jgi:acetate kinase